MTMTSLARPVGRNPSSPASSKAPSASSRPSRSGSSRSLARFSLAAVFWMSARTKVAEGTCFSLSDNAVWLFSEEYKLPLLPPEIAAHLSLVGEHLFPILLVIGLASRFAALGLLVMTLVIEVFVYPAAYPVHGPWAVCCLVIMIHGPGILSLDHLIKRRATTG